MIGFFTTLISLAAAGCDTCPPSMAVKLGNGATVTVDAGTGVASQANTTWAVYADSFAAPLAYLGTLIPEVPGLLFRIDFGPQGQMARVFDNKIASPETLGTEFFLDGVLHPAADPDLTYVGQSFGAEDGTAIALTGCGIVHSGPFSIIHATIRFSGSVTSVLDTGILARADGTLILTSKVEPLLAPFLPSDVMSESKEIQAFALREN